jgi:sialate O-acetylesterase
VDDVKGSWQACSPETVPNFSAVAYFFGRDLQASIGVPVGLIHTSWGGSPAEAWMRQAVLEGDTDYKTKYLDTYAEAKRRFDEDLAKWEKENAEAQAAGKKVGRGRPGIGWRPSELYDGMIAPVIPYGIAGAIWYQGESNAGAAYLYRRLFADMIRNWRKDFGQGEFPFLTVQLAPWDKGRKRSFSEISALPTNSDWPELREAQSIASAAVGHADVAVITDVGDKDDIHPTKKEPVGHRLSLLARKIAYNQKVEAHGPTLKKVKFKNGKAFVRFDHVGEGLQARTGKVTGFAIAGSDGNFVWANADIDGDTVVVSHPSVKEPAAVRFGWADYPVVDLWNSAGLPASPFRTDNFQMVTAPKK